MRSTNKTSRWIRSSPERLGETVPDLELRLQPRPLGGLSHENCMDQHKILPVPETFRISLDRYAGAHAIWSSGGKGPKHGPAEHIPSTDPEAGRVVALHRDHTGIHLPRD